MRKRYFAIIIVIYLIAGGFTTSQDKTDTITRIHFKHWVGNKELVLFDETYKNNFDEPFVISKFRYYISAISFTDINNRETILPAAYYLVNEADSLSKIIQLPVAAPIKSISFIIGVDSIRNISGVQTGSLDPANGMFWTWNSG
ncbi:MAG: MbnP family protein, partial [Bacteroidota bacterium]